MQGWLQPRRAHARGDPRSSNGLTGRPNPNLALSPGSRRHQAMPPPPSATYERLRHTIAERRPISPVVRVMFGNELNDAQRLTINVFRVSSMRT
jgi:hypothetical protein